MDARPRFNAISTEHQVRIPVQDGQYFGGDGLGFGAHIDVPSLRIPEKIGRFHLGVEFEDRAGLVALAGDVVIHPHARDDGIARAVRDHGVERRFAAVLYAEALAQNVRPTLEENQVGDGNQQKQLRRKSFPVIGHGG